MTEESLWSRLRSLSDVLAPLSVFAAFLTYIGWVRTRSFYDYFGVNLSLLGCTPQDYVFRSADVTLGGLLVLVLAATVLLLVDRLLIAVVGRLANRLWERRLRVAAVIASTGAFWPSCSGRRATP